MKIDALERSWEWPEEDTKCRKVVFDWSSDLEIVYAHCRDFRTCIQAGGNMGVWPWHLSKRFEKVITFEADRTLHKYLYENVKGCKNVSIHPVGLFYKETMGTVCNDDPGNLGAQYVLPCGGDTPLVTLDSLEEASVDLICLDIEGAELDALKGAYYTIAECRPTIVVEDKGLSRRYGSEKGTIVKYLSDNFDYEIVARPHRDVVLCPRA